MKNILKRVWKRIQWESKALFQKIRKTIFPLWFIHPISRKLFFLIYEKSSFSRKEYYLSEYIQKNGTRWIRSNFDFEIRFHSETIKIPIRPEFFGGDMGLAFCILGLDSEVKSLYHRLFKNDCLRDHLKILDIGANLGQNLLLFCSQTKEVTAFEPNPGCLEEIKKSLEYNRYTPRLVHAAVGSVQGELILRWPTGCSWYGTVSDTAHLNQMGYEKFEEYRVRVVALDQEVSISGEKILLKIDVEGHEIDVLQGGQDLLCQNDCLVVFEHDFSRPLGREKIWSFLNSIDYGLFQIVADASKPLLEVPTMEEYLADHRSNHAAVKRKSEFSFLKNS